MAISQVAAGFKRQVSTGKIHDFLARDDSLVAASIASLMIKANSTPVAHANQTDGAVFSLMSFGLVDHSECC